MKTPKASDYKGNPMGYFADKSRARKKAAFGTTVEDEDPPMTKAEFKAEKKALQQKNKLNKILYRGDVQEHKAENKLNDDRTFLDKANQVVSTIGDVGGKVVGAVTGANNIVKEVLPTVSAVKNVFSPGNSANYEGGANVAPGMTTTPDTKPVVNTYNPPSVPAAEPVIPVAKTTVNPVNPVKTRRTTSRRYKKGGPVSKTDMSQVRKNAKKVSPLLHMMDQKNALDKAKKSYIK